MRRRRLQVTAAVLAVFALAGALVLLRRDDGPRTRADYCDPPGLVHAVSEATEDPRRVAPRFVQLARLERAVAAAVVPDGRIFIAVKDGQLWQRPADGAPLTVALDLADEVATGTEQGLLGVAAHPDGGTLYLNVTLSDGTARILEFSLTPDGVDPATRREVLVLQDPHPSHNGGHMEFDDRGMLLVGIGDGGNGDQTGAAQDLSSLFGKILRIDPRSTAEAAYGIPPDNPFIGDAGSRAEIWAYGLRNPWAWSIDSVADELWVGDVGQLCFEEVSRGADRGAGANFGWPFAEGAHEFQGPVLGLDGEPIRSLDPVDLGAPPDDLVPPVFEYRHGDAACSVIGGVVYRGAAVAELRGTYLWADLCEHAIHTLRQDGDTWLLGRLDGEVPFGTVSFAEDSEGEVYLVSLEDGLFKMTAP
ncbi:MAG: PQQ-dependent sugar dehydrogenase [Actinomycetota bacterium]